VNQEKKVTKDVSIEKIVTAPELKIESFTSALDGYLKESFLCLLLDKYHS
jgi:hypothetical protein